MNTPEAILWGTGTFLWLLWAAWIIADAIEDTAAGDFMERTFLRIARPLDHAIQRITATRK